VPPDEQYAAPYAPGTARNIENTLAGFLHTVGETGPAKRMMKQLSQNDVANWRNSLNHLSDSTKQTQYAYLQGLFNFAYSEQRKWTYDQLTVMTKEERRRVRPERSTHVIMEDSQVLEIIAGLEAHKRAAVYLLAATGLRQGELRSLTRADIVDGAIHVPEPLRARTKLHERIIPLGEGGRQFLTSLPTEGLLFTDGSRPWTSQLNRWLGNWSAKPHDFRRWFNNRLCRLGCPAYTVDYLMGHAISAVRQAYPEQHTSGHVLISDLAKWTDQVDAILRPAMAR
jgi:integrase